jgi:hypothetical protein
MAGSSPLRNCRPSRNHPGLSKVELQCEFINETKSLGGSATVLLPINGKEAGTGKVEKQVVGRFGLECLDVGADTLSPVCKSYGDKRPFAFTGKIEKVQFDFDGAGRELTAQEKFELQARMD